MFKTGKNLLIVLAILSIFTGIVSAADTTPPNSVTNLKNISYATTYINWTWKEPTNVDFAKVKVYIDGTFKVNVTKGIRYYKATGLLPNTSHIIGTRTVDTVGNINGTLVSNTSRTALDSTLPRSITNLKNISYEPYYINWTWTDPTTTDFAYVMVYINGIFKANVAKGIRYYDAIGLTPKTKYTISTHSVDTSSNINKTWVNKSTYTAEHKLRFITIGDPHLRFNITDDQSQRLIKIVNYINKNNTDLVVVMGDEANNGTATQFSLTKSILKNLTKPYYVLAGSHDISRDNTTFITYFGPMENIAIVKGYQLLFVGIKKNGTGFNWTFNFSKADKNMPTIVFLHGAVQPPPKSCNCTWGSYFRYAADMQPELDKFTKLIGVYSGHVHRDTDQTFTTPSIYPVRYITINGLIDDTIGGYKVNASKYIGYSVVNNDALNYSLVPYI